MSKTKLSFSVDSQLLGELGERLVAKNHIALAELIKNSYDADAKSVKVSFICDVAGDISTCSSIVIRDSGVGMGLEDIRDKWMIVATSNKSREPYSELFGRPKTGNKGIGRFACQKLAGRLILESAVRTRGGFEKTYILFVWDEYRAGKDLGAIKVTAETEILQKGSVGTTLTLLDIKGAWTQRDLDTLKRTIAYLSLADVIERPGYKPDPGFSVEIDGISDFSAKSLAGEIKSSGWGTLEGKIDDLGVVSLSLQANHIGREKKFTLPSIVKDLAGVEFEINHLPFSDFGNEIIPRLYRNKSLLTKGVASEIKEWAGIKVFYKSFRVFPLGDKDDDWLGMDRDYAKRSTKLPEFIGKIAESLDVDLRKAALNRPRNETLFGHVNISGLAAESLQVSMDREGFVENKAFADLRGVIRASIDWMSLYRQLAVAKVTASITVEGVERLREAVGGAEEGDAVVDNPTVALDYLVKQAKRTERDADDVRPLQAATVAKRIIEARYDQLEAELAILRTLASSAPLFFTFSHEVHALINRLISNASALKGLARRLDGVAAERALETSQALTLSADSFRKVYSLFSVMGRVKASSPERVYVKKAIDMVVAGVGFSAERMGVEFEVDCDQNIKSPLIREAELISVLINLVSNSLKSCAANRGGKVKVSSFYDGNEFFLQVQDTGVGLPHKYWEEVFEPFVSDPAGAIYPRLDTFVEDETTASLGKGTGLGLSIIKGIVSSHKGAVEIFKDKGWNFSIRVSLPRSK